MSLKFWSFIAFLVIMIVTLCRIYSKEHRTRIGSWTRGSKVLLITGQEKLFHLKVKIEVSTVSQITSTLRRTGSTEFYLCTIALALLLFMLISIFGFRGLQSFRDFGEMGPFSVAILIIWMQK